MVSHLRDDGDGIGHIEVPGVVQPDGGVEGVGDGSPRHCDCGQVETVRYGWPARAQGFMDENVKVVVLPHPHNAKICSVSPQRSNLQL